MKKWTAVILPITGFIILGLIPHCEKVVYTYDDQQPVIVSGPNILSVTDSTAEIYWETDEACHVKIKYGLSTKYDFSLTDQENRELHRLQLTGLAPYTWYHYRLYNWDFAGNGPAKSIDAVFLTEHNEHSFLREGWRCYALGDYDSARFFFKASLARNTIWPETYAAFGWLQIKVDSLDAANQSFLEAYDLNRYLPITLAGRATLSMIDNQPAEAIAYLTPVLEADANWTYTYNEDISWKRLRLILAEAYFQTDNLSQAQDQLNILWPANGLNPDLPVSWKVGTQSYNSYAEAFIAALNYLIANPEKIGK